MVREGRVLISSAGDPDFGASYSVQVLEVGAQVTSGSSGNTITVRAGHGFAALDKLIVGTDTSQFKSILSVTSTQLTLDVGQTCTVSAGDLLVNLAADTGSSIPLYDGAGLTVYSDMAYGSSVANNTVTTDANGRYRYYHKGIARWELVRAGSTLISLYTDTSNPADEDQVFYAVRYAHLFATSGTGTAADPWVTSGSNPVQAALNNLPSTGGTVFCVPGFYTLGTADPAVTIPITTSASDARSYVIEGSGKDLTYLDYSGTGVAIEYWQDNTGTPGASIQSNRNVLRGFTLRQTGTSRTGTGVWLNYASHWVIEDINFGTPRWNRASGDQGFSYGMQCNERSVGYQSVDDFNIVNRCRFSGNTHALLAIQQSDNLRVTECYFEANPAVSSAQDGLEIKNSNGVLISGNTFNYFSSASSFGVKLTTDISGVSILGNYFEGNTSGIWLYTDGNQDGVCISGNMISTNNITGGVGVRAGIDGVTFKVRGLVIQGNTLDGINTSDIGIRIGSDVANYFLIGNWYSFTAGTRTTLQSGSAGVVLESVDSSPSAPQLRMYHYGEALGGVRLENKDTAAGASPRISFQPGASASVFSLQASTSGSLSFLDNANASILDIGQTGVINASQEIRAGGDTGGAASKNTLTNGSNLASAGATFTTKGVSGGTARNNDGWMKFYIGTTAYYVPVWSTITG